MEYNNPSSYPVYNKIKYIYWHIIFRIKPPCRKETPFIYRAWGENHQIKIVIKHCIV